MSCCDDTSPTCCDGSDIKEDDTSARTTPIDSEGHSLDVGAWVRYWSELQREHAVGKVLTIDPEFVPLDAAAPKLRGWRLRVQRSNLWATWQDVCVTWIVQRPVTVLGAPGTREWWPLEQGHREHLVAHAAAHAEAARVALEQAQIAMDEARRHVE